MLTNQDNQLTLTWDPVTAASDGGYLAPEDVRYDIYDGETLVESGLTGCVFNKTVETSSS